MVDSISWTRARPKPPLDAIPLPGFPGGPSAIQASIEDSHAAVGIKRHCMKMARAGPRGGSQAPCRAIPFPRIAVDGVVEPGGCSAVQDGYTSFGIKRHGVELTRCRSRRRLEFPAR